MLCEVEDIACDTLVDLRMVRVKARDIRDPLTEETPNIRGRTK